MFFVKKIADIRAGLDSASNCDKQRDDRFSSVRCFSSLRDFALLDADSVRSLVAKALINHVTLIQYLPALLNNVWMNCFRFLLPSLTLRCKQDLSLIIGN